MVTPNTDFITELREKAQAKAQEIKLLRRELDRLDMEIARAKIYVSHLNCFLISEGYESVPDTEIKEGKSEERNGQ